MGNEFCPAMTTKLMVIVPFVEAVSRDACKCQVSWPACSEKPDVF